MQDTLSFLAAYTAANLPTFPLRPRDKIPATINGVKNATTTSAATYAADWSRGCNVGLATGFGVDVIDADEPDALIWLAKRCEPCGEFECFADAVIYFERNFGPVVTTGKGAHVYVQSNGRHNTVRLAGQKIDYRGVGGYVVAPPSIHPNGETYRFYSNFAWPKRPAPDWLWSDDARLDDSQTLTLAQNVRASANASSATADQSSATSATTTVAAPPTAPINQPTRKPIDQAYFDKVLQRRLAEIRSSVEGNRNDTLNTAVFSILQVCDTDARAKDAVAKIWTEALAVGLSRKEIASTLKSAAKAGRAQPWQPKPANNTDAAANTDGQKKAHRLTLAELVDLIENDSLIAGIIAFNEFANELTLTRPIPGAPQRTTPCPWRDSDAIDLRVYLSTIGHDPPKELVFDAIDRVGHMHAYHPLRDYLQACKANWDHQSRIVGLLAALGATPHAAHKIEITYWLAGAAARGAWASNTAIKLDNMIILEGAQGVGKSRALAALGGQWFSDTELDLDSKDAYLQLAGAWIIEWAELQTMAKQSPTKLKQFLSAKEDRFRPPYGRTVVQQNRQCAFAGSTNDDVYLHDATGNRRFWPIACDPSAGRIDVDWIAENRDQIWGEAMILAEHYRKTGYAPQNAAEAAVLAEYVGPRQSVDELADDVLEALQGLWKPLQSEHWASVNEVAKKLNRTDYKSKSLIRQVLIMLGGAERRPRGTDGQPRARSFFFASTPQRRDAEEIGHNWPAWYAPTEWAQKNGAKSTL